MASSSLPSSPISASDVSTVSPVWGRLSDLVIERAEGCYVFTRDGERYLDFTSGIGVTNTGHCHPVVVKAIQEQAAKVMHAQVNCYFHTGLLALCDALNEVTAPELNSFFLANSGAEAVEASVKLARHATKRPNIIVFQGSFHGRTAQTMAMTTAKTVYRQNYQPLPAGVIVAPFPFAHYQRNDENTASIQALEQLELLLMTQSAPEETAAMIIEPVLGEGGYIPVPFAFMQGLRALCDKHGILLIADEVQSGFGRTGKFFAYEHAGVTPDILVMAKGMGSGFPISGIAASRELMQAWQVGTHGGTYGGNAMACAAAHATLRVLKDEQLIENAAARGEQLMAGLRALQTRYPVMSDVRGLGLMVGCEFRHPDTFKPDPHRSKTVMRLAKENGHLLLLSCGMYGNAIRWIPPLTVTKEHIEEGLRIFEDALHSSDGA